MGDPPEPLSACWENTPRFKLTDAQHIPRFRLVATWHIPRFELAATWNISQIKTTQGRGRGVLWNRGRGVCSGNNRTSTRLCQTERRGAHRPLITQAMPSPGLEAGFQARGVGLETEDCRVPSLCNLGRSLVFAGNGTKGTGCSNKVDRISGSLLHRSA